MYREALERADAGVAEHFGESVHVARDTALTYRHSEDSRAVHRDICRDAPTDAASRDAIEREQYLVTVRDTGNSRSSGHPVVRRPQLL